MIQKMRIRERLQNLGARLKVFFTRLLTPHKWERDTQIFVVVLLLYAVTRLIALDKFPIYFFTDEAAQTVLAEDLVNNDFRDGDGTLLPTYFENNYLYNLSLSVYMQVIPYLLFGKTVFVTRAVSALISVLAAIAVGLILRDIFRIRLWWIGSLALSITPAWFLHSRTAFETVIFVSMYALMLYFYMRYRSGSPANLLLTILFAGLAFYSYSGGQLIIAGTALLLFISDFRYHIAHKRTLLLSLLLVLLIALPYVRFQLDYEGETYFHLRMLGTYWLENIPLQEKIGTFFKTYLQGLNPIYWYLPLENDLARHIMQGYGHIIIATLPFMLIGLIDALRNWKQSHQRTVLIAMICSPLGASIVGIGITRILSFVIPAALLTAVGISRLADWLSPRISHKAIGYVAILLLGGTNIFMLYDSVTHGYTWYGDYGLYGAQYGAQQVFEAVEEHARMNPNDRIFVSPTWSNGTHILQRFFLPEDLNVHLGNADYFLLEKRDLDEHTLLVLTEKEYANLRDEEKVTDIHVEQVLKYPDGSDGFFFIRMRYVANIDEILAAEKTARQQPVKNYVEIDNQMVTIEHTQIDLGKIEYIFDDDPFTLIRTFDINPFTINFNFAHPISLSGIAATTGSMDIVFTVLIYGDWGPEPIELSDTFTNLPDDPTVELTIPDGPKEVTRIEITILGQSLSDDKVHIRDINFY
jgi:4-amino-4-deoxy-L-arabinose transferase-like glycosyltransferase